MVYDRQQCLYKRGLSCCRLRLLLQNVHDRGLFDVPGRERDLKRAIQPCSRRNKPDGNYREAEGRAGQCLVDWRLGGRGCDDTGYGRPGDGRVLYLPADAGTAATAVVWDPTLGVRPAPTEFAKVDGHQEAVIRSLTNSVYVLVSKTSRFTDIQGHWAAAEIGRMNSRMIVLGVDESRFAPEAVITRAELAALLARALGLPEGGDHAGFRDVSESIWYSRAVKAVQAYGIMDGFSDGTFGPNREVSRQEAIVTIVRALRLASAASVTSNAGAQVNLAAYTDSNQIGGWASDAIRTAIHIGLVKGYGNELRPQKPLTRAETTVLLYRMLQKAGFIDG